jgi:hypothetical protein
MQLYPGRPADQWRGFAALDAGNSREPITRYDSAKHRAAWRHQHRSHNDGYANAEHTGMRREHHDESGNAWHDGTSQRHGRCGNAGRLAAPGLLTGEFAFPTPSRKTADASKSMHSRHPDRAGCWKQRSEPGQF